MDLTITAEQRAISEVDIEVFGADDSTALLEAQAGEGERRSVDGVEIEDTEWRYDTVRPSAPLEVENFWAAEPLRGGEARDERGSEEGDAGTTSAELDAPTAAPEWPGSVGASSDQADDAPSDASDGRWGTWPAAGWSAPREVDGAPADEGSDWEPAEPAEQTEPAGAASGGEYGSGAGGAIDMGSMVEETPAFAPARPEQPSRGDELTAALDWPDAVDLAHLAMPEGDERVPDGAALDAVRSELRASAEPWAEENPAPTVAEALERIARKIREGAVVLPSDAPADSDAGALAAALTALLRGHTR
ncbi:MAG TPA: hypothetical protein VF041_21040 [Gemmatimonadaceae bacterium]